MSSITVEVSIGEALDKLSILSIKLSKIEDVDKKKEINKEFVLLENMLSEHKDKYAFQYKILCKINESIWNKLVMFRKHSTSKLFEEITDENDDRYRVKNKINILCDSKIKEQKGYKVKRAFVLSHLGLGDCICMNGLVRYLATKYDNVKVVCKQLYKQNLELMYRDDKSIDFYPVQYDSEISVLNFGFDKKKFDQITDGYDVYMCGHHIEYPNKHYNDLPFNFYDTMKIDRSVFWDYYHIDHPFLFHPHL